MFNIVKALSANYSAVNGKLYNNYFDRQNRSVYKFKATPRRLFNLILLHFLI